MPPKQRVDQELQQQINKLAKAGTISRANARTLWTAALDGPGVTQTEFHTFQGALEDKKIKFSGPGTHPTSFLHV